MKKIFATVIATIISLSVFGNNAPADSLAVAFGNFVGSAMRFQAGNDNAFNKAEFINGFEKIVNSDTSRYYMAGMQVALQVMNDIVNLEEQGVKFDRKKFVAEFKNALMQTDSIDQKQLQSMQSTFQRLVQEATGETKANDPKAAENLRAGQAYISEKVQQGYIKTGSGLAYKVLAEGAGANFTDNDRILTKYVGRHIDGTVFDKSEQPVPFTTQGVIPGFAEMLKLMKPGMKVEVIIPGELGYGSRGAGGVIGPNETLVFELETIGVE